MKNIPDKIYLNLGFNKNIKIEDFNDLRISEITWSRSRLFSTDLEFEFTGVSMLCPVCQEVTCECDHQKRQAADPEINS